MDRLTNKKEADAQRKSYERRLKQGYPRNIPEERFLKLAAYEDAEEEGRWVALPSKTHDVDFMRIFELIMADGEGRAIMLPCKVGDTVYYIDGGKSYKAKVSSFRINESGVRVYCERNFMGYIGFEGIYSKTVFLTREAAETALKEGVSN